MVKDERKYYLLNVDASASLPALVALARCRWPIEQQCFLSTMCAGELLVGTAVAEMGERVGRSMVSGAVWRHVKRND